VSLVPVEIDIVKPGDSFTYALLIDNIGTTTIVLPWSSDTFAFTQPDRRIPPGFRTAIIDPSVEDDQGQVIARLGALRLFGSNELTDSLLQLMPGKTALIRVQVRWAVQADEQRAVANALSKGSVYFVAAFAVPEENDLYVRSTNRLRFRGQP
jgi:hypothetical protein